jgi:hypothetical protein
MLHGPWYKVLLILDSLILRLYFVDSPPRLVCHDLSPLIFL